MIIKLDTDDDGEMSVESCAIEALGPIQREFEREVVVRQNRLLHLRCGAIFLVSDTKHNRDALKDWW